MIQATRFIEKEFPFNYLQCTIYIEKKELLISMVHLLKIVKKFGGWHTKLLSHGGKLILIKHVVQAIPVYTITTMNPHKEAIELIEKKFAKFFFFFGIL